LELVANPLKPGGQVEEAPDVSATPALLEITGKVSTQIRPGM
jgi:hypothetical protein